MPGSFGKVHWTENSLHEAGQRYRIAAVFEIAKANEESEAEQV